MAALEGSEGNNKVCAANAKAARMAVAMNDARHDDKPLMNVPSGTPITVAKVTPLKIIAVALAACCCRTSRPAVASAKVQKPPNAAPSSARPNNITANDGANAEIRFEASNNIDKTSKIKRRLMRPAPNIRPGAEMAATTPGVVTINPAVPGDTPRSCAICGNKPTGKNSVVTKAKAPTATDTTDSQDRKCDAAFSSVLRGSSTTSFCALTAAIFFSM